MKSILFVFALAVTLFAYEWLLIARDACSNRPGGVTLACLTHTLY